MSNPLLLQLASLQDISRSLRKGVPLEGMEQLKQEYNVAVDCIDKNGGSILLMSIALIIKLRIRRREKKLKRIYSS